eukprot:362070-Chlamydomonas_euryale.AAC.24
MPKGIVLARKLQFFSYATSAQKELSNPSRCRATPSGVKHVVYFPPTAPSCTSSKTAARALERKCQWAPVEHKPAQRELEWVAAGHGQPQAANQASLTAGIICVSVRCTGMSANLTNQVTYRLKIPVSTWHRQAALALISASQRQKGHPLGKYVVSTTLDTKQRSLDNTQHDRNK